MTRWQLAAFGLLASFACMVPLFFTDAAGDLLHQYTMIECYGHQLWTGHFYPTWCMNANAGYGSPVPIFYFPLPYYFAAIFYPLRYVGLDIPAIYQIAVFGTHFLTFSGIFAWLKPQVLKPLYAAIGAVLFLVLSYRMELVYFRAAYSELFCVAILPWLFVRARCWAGSLREISLLGVIVALGLLSHPSVMAMGYGVGFVYMLVMSPPTLRKIIAFAAAGLLAIAATSFHWAIMQYFAPFLSETTGGTAWLQNVWVNSFADKIDDPHIHQLHYVHLATLLLGFMLFVVMGRKNWQKETIFFACMAVVATLMSYSVSAGLWELLEMIIKVKIPWRMALFPSFFVVLVTVKMLQEKSCRAIGGLALITFMVLGLMVIPPAKRGPADAKELIIATKKILAFARPRWVDARYDNDDARDFYRHFVFDRPKENAALLDGSEVKISQWDDDALILSTNSKQGGQLVIEQFYFPLWQATINGKPQALKPLDDGTGRIALEVPAGKSDVVIKQDIIAAMPPYYLWIRLVSLLSFLLMMVTATRKCKV